MIVRNYKSKPTLLEIGCIDYRKAYDIVPDSWITKCLNMFRVCDNMIELLMDSLTQWEVILKSGNVELGDVRIK